MIQQAILGAATEVKAAAAAPLWLYDRNDIFLNSCFVDRAARSVTRPFSALVPRGFLPSTSTPHIGAVEADPVLPARSSARGPTTPAVPRSVTSSAGACCAARRYPIHHGMARMGRPR